MLSMSTSFTVNLQYGDNSMYNEIEHNDNNNNTLNEIKENLKNKVCHKIAEFDFIFTGQKTKMFFYENEHLVSQYTLRNDTPPPEFVG